ncbi:MAG TPA: hypothetical protein VMW50_00915 [Dehalococcoidia bacterium]|nr:hypothetical protein [Dehalococcoidia bacterium]
MADFGRGIKAGVITVIAYMVIAAILGAIYYNSLSGPFSVPDFVVDLISGAGLMLFTWRSFTDLSGVIELLQYYVVSGILFGAVFAAMYNFLPGTTSIKKGMVLSAFLWILGALWLIYVNLGWPTGTEDISISKVTCVTVRLSTVIQALAGIISALVFGALTGFLWDRFRGKKLTEARKGSPVLLLSLILGWIMWLAWAVMFVAGVVTNRGIPPIGPDFLWFDLLNMLVVFLGLPGWVLAAIAWRKTKRGESGLKWGVAGGVLMALTGLMLLPGALAITGGVFSGRKPASESSVAAIGQ